MALLQWFASVSRRQFYSEGTLEKNVSHVHDDIRHFSSRNRHEERASELLMLAGADRDPAAWFDVGGALHRVRACSVTHAASLKPIPSHHQRALAVLGQGSPLHAAPTGRDDD